MAAGAELEKRLEKTKRVSILELVMLQVIDLTDDKITRSIPKQTQRPVKLDNRWMISSKIDQMIVPMQFSFTMVRNDGERCRCALEGFDVCCNPNCANANQEKICTEDTCSLGSRCGNRLANHPGLNLRPTTKMGYGVFASKSIAKGSVVAPYWGTVVDSRVTVQATRCSLRTQCKCTRLERALHASSLAMNRKNRGNPCRNESGRQAVRRGRKRNPKPTSKAAYIKPSPVVASPVSDGVERVIATMVIVAEYAIREETELTVDYGKDLWFKCRCNHDNCRNPA
ncbi:SET domain [Phytophthora cactorum]|nr:SET domain [Phytophthora cactorum]